jgi:hypothetical protein
MMYLPLVSDLKFEEDERRRRRRARDDGIEVNVAAAVGNAADDDNMEPVEVDEAVIHEVGDAKWSYPFSVQPFFTTLLRMLISSKPL